MLLIVLLKRFFQLNHWSSYPVLTVRAINVYMCCDHTREKLFLTAQGQEDNTWGEL